MLRFGNVVRRFCGGTMGRDRGSRRDPGTITPAARVTAEHGNAYNIFILVLTIFSLLVMALQLLPLTQAEKHLLLVYDNAVCVIFLADFFMNLARSKPKREYFISKRGWLDLLGSIPSFGFFQFSALFRLARLSRLARITRLLRGQAGKDLVRDVLANRSQYATFITILLAGIVLNPLEPRRAGGREQVSRREHHDRRRRALVGPRDDYDRWLRGLLSNDAGGAPHGHLRDVRGHRDHRRPR